jgi:hypothetical protein
MARQDDIEELLRRIAPLFLEIARYAQQAAAELGETEWGRAHLVRTATVNQVSGTARWRMVGDGIVTREAELPEDVELSTTDSEQNQGRYYLRAARVAIVLTIRRRPHPPDGHPVFLQLQIDGVNEVAPVEFDDDIVVYLAVPRLGYEPRFEVDVRGKQTISYRLIDLVPQDGDEGTPPPVENMPTGSPPGPIVSSALDDDQEEHGDEHEEDSTQPPG